MVVFVGLGGHGALEPVRQRGHGLQELCLRRVRQGKRSLALACLQSLGSGPVNFALTLALAWRVAASVRLTPKPETRKHQSL